LKVSIITIVYNNQKSIEDCLKSVQNQTYPIIEHIVIDGGSTDGTQTKIEPYKSKLAYYVSEKDNGLYDALNKGIKIATGDIVGILHSDDVFLNNNTIQKVVDSFFKSKADVVYAKGLYVNKDNLNKVKRIYPSNNFKKWFLYFGWIPLHTTIYVKKKIFEQYGLYNISYSIASDYEISLRWFKNKAIKKYYLNKWVVKMRLGGKSTTPKLQQKKSKEDLEIIKSFKLWSVITLAFKIGRKIPYYVAPIFIDYKKRLKI